MDVREYVNSEYSKHLDTEGLRKNYLIEKIFAADEVTMTYSHVDRMIAGGIMQRRELGLINIGQAGRVTVDGKVCEVGSRDALYIGMGSKDLKFESVDPANPAKFYYNSCPAHHTYANQDRIDMKDLR